MAGYIGEYISNKTVELKTWTLLSSLITWKTGNGFTNGKKYAIFNNSPTTIRFISNNSPLESQFGTVMSQGSTIYYRPDRAENIYVKGTNFNLVISEL